MLRIDNSSQQNPSLWETVLPPEIFQMNEELTKVDKLLDDERFFVPFRERFGTRIGRPTRRCGTAETSRTLSRNKAAPASAAATARDCKRKRTPGEGRPFYCLQSRGRRFSPANGGPSEAG